MYIYKTIMVEYHIFVDGSINDQSKTYHQKHRRKAGIGIFIAKNEYIEEIRISEPFPLENPTNIRAEWWAVTRSLMFVLQKHESDTIEEIQKIQVFLYCDCNNVVLSIQKWISQWKKRNWRKSNKKPVENREIIEQVDSIIQTKLPRTNIIKIKSHQPKPYNTESREYWLWYGNYIADKLANEGRFKDIL